MTSALLEAVCGAVLYDSDQKNQTLVFIGERQRVISENIRVAFEFYASKCEKHTPISTCAKLLKLLNQTSNEAKLLHVPYLIKLEVDGLEIKKINVSLPFATYSDFLMLPATLLFGAPKHMRDVLKLSEIEIENVKKIKLNQIPVCKEFYKQLQSVFEDEWLAQSACLEFLLSSIAAILHLKSGNAQIAEELLGLDEGILSDIIQKATSVDTVYNALFTCTVRQIFKHLLRESIEEESDKSEMESDKSFVKVIGICNNFSGGSSWRDFYENYLTDIIHLSQQSDENQLIINWTEYSKAIGGNSSTLKDFMTGTRDVLKLAKNNNKCFKIYQTTHLVTYGGGFSRMFEEFNRIASDIDVLIGKSNKWELFKSFQTTEVTAKSWNNLLMDLDTLVEDLRSSKLRVIHCFEMRETHLSSNVFCPSPGHCSLCLNENSAFTLAELQAHCRFTSEPDDDPKSHSEELIKEYIQQKGLELEDVQNRLSKHFQGELSDNDRNFVQTKYVEYLLQIWFQETLKLCLNIGKDNFQKYLDAIDNFTKLSEIPCDFCNSRYLELLKVHAKMIPEDDEKQYIKKFKDYYKNHLLQLNESLRREFDIISAVAEYVRSCKNVREAIKNSKLHDFVFGQIDFKQFRSAVIGKGILSGSKGTDLEILLKLMDENLQMSQLSRLQRFLSNYEKPPKINTEILGDDKCYIEARGMVITLQEIISEIKKHVAMNKAIAEVRLIAFDFLYLDTNIEDEDFKGLNMVIYCPTLVVCDARRVDVSGRNSTFKYSSDAGTGSGGCGNDGKDGYAGESGGNIIILADEILNGKNLYLVSNGGNGGNGQDGGNGEDGTNGTGLSSKDLDENYKSPMRWLFGASGMEKMCNRIKNITDEGIYRWDSGFFHLEIYMNRNGSDGKNIHFQFSKNACSSNYHDSFLYKGTKGTSGKLGGFCGLGGQGGKGGTIAVFDYEVHVASSSGTNGEDGICGLNGKSGLDGWDIGYLDYRWWTNPVYRGKSENSKLQLRFFKDKTSKSDNTGSEFVYCRYLDEWLEINHVGTIPTTNSSLQKRRDEIQRTKLQSQAEAVRKHISPISELKDSYSQMMENSRKCIDETDTNEEQSALRKNQALLEQTQEETMEEEKINVKVKRETKIPKIPKVTRYAFRKTEKSTSNVKLFDQHSNFLVEGIAELKRINFEPKEIALLVELTSAKAIEKYKLNNRERVLLTHVALSLHKRSKLSSFAQRLYNIRAPTGGELKIDETKFLQVDDSKSGINHERLGTLDKFVLKDELIQRKELITFCKQNATAQFLTASLKLFLSSILHDVMTRDAHGIYKKYADEFAKFEITKRLELKRKYYEIETMIEGNTVAEECWEQYQTGELDRMEFKKHIKVDGVYDTLKEIFKEYDTEFNMQIIREDDLLMKMYYDHLQSQGLESSVYLQLLADVFEVQLKTFSGEKYGDYQWKNTFNLDKQRIMKASRSKLGAWKILQINENHMALERERSFKSKFANNLLYQALYANSKDAIEQLTFEIDGEFSGINLQCTCEPLDAVLIAKSVNSIEFFKILKMIRSAQSDSSNIVLHTLAHRFSYEECKIDEQIMKFIINYLLRTVINGTYEIPLLQWIFSVEPQDYWVSEITLLHLQNYCQNQMLDTIAQMRSFLRNIPNQELLILFNLQLDAHRRSEKYSAERLLELLHLLSRVYTVPQKIYETDISNWKYFLEYAYWSEQLRQLLPETDDNVISATIYYIQALEINHEKSLLIELIKTLTAKSHFLSAEELASCFLNFYTEEWLLNSANLKRLTAASNRESLNNWMENASTSKQDGSERNMDELAKIIKERKSSDGAKNFLDELLQSMDNESYQTFKKTLQSEKLTLKDSFFAKIKSIKSAIHKKTINDGIAENLEMLEAIDHCIFLKRGFRLRDAQKMSVMMLLNNDSNTLIQVATGEGKTLIVVAVAIIKAKKGESVDIVTSSPVLAKRDAKINQDIYCFFGITVHHNCDDNLQKRIEAYSKNQVIYGHISNFQQDYLLERFYGKNILGSRRLKNVIVDEVDSMLLDKGNNILYLSHDLPLLDQLLPVYIYIWNCINMPASSEEQLALVLDHEIIRDKILHDLYGLIKKEDLRLLKSDLRDDEINDIYELLINENILNKNGTVNRFDYKAVNVLINDKYPVVGRRLNFKLKELENRKSVIDIPNSLKPFAVQHLTPWIKSAQNAFCMKEKEMYIVDINRTEGSSELNPNIIIMDIDTGTDQANSQWDEALHQFLQIKHGCRVSSQSLKAVFISNVTYFQMYENIYGLTGTLGSQREQTLLQDLHKVNFVTIPTSKPKKFHEDAPLFCEDLQTWKEAIKEEAFRKINDEKRSVLMICETLEHVEMFKNYFKSFNIEAQTYTRDFQDFNFNDENKLQTGKIVISTNLAGRGTDVKISDELIANKGLHTILTFLPQNSRIEQQAFGRAARCGEPGSGRQIFTKPDSLVQNVILLKNMRDEDEGDRISHLKNYYEHSIKIQELCFDKFKTFYRSMSSKMEEKSGKLERVIDYGSKILDLATLNLFEFSNTDEQSLIDTPEEIREIVLQSFLDEWAFWLDSQSEEMSNVCREDDAVVEKCEDFILQLGNRKGYAKMAAGNTAATLRLAKFFLKEKRPDAAIQLYDSIIELEPDHSEAAHYYKALALGMKSKWNRDDINKYVIPELKIAKAQFERQKKKSFSHSGVIAQLKKFDRASKIVQIDAFERQQEDIIKIYDVFLHSINSIIGQAIMPQDFYKNDQISKIESEDIFHYLQSEGIISKTFFNASLGDLKKMEKEYGISEGELDKVLAPFFKASLDDENKMIEALSQLDVPGSEKLWQILASHGALVEEVELKMINPEELKDYDENVFKTIKENLLDKWGNGLNETPDGFLSLYPPDQKGELVSVPVTEYNLHVSQNIRNKLSAIVSTNKRAKLDIEALKKLNIKNYCNVKIENFRDQGFEEGDAKHILSQLEEAKFLIKEGDYYCLQENLMSIDIIKFKEFPVFDDAVRNLLETHFCYQFVYQALLSEKSVKCLESMPMKVSSRIFMDLVDDNVLETPKVSFEGKLKLEDDFLDNLYDKYILQDAFYKKLQDHLKNESKTKHVLKVLGQRRSVLKSLDSPEGTLESILVSFPRCNNDFLTLIHQFSLQSLEDVIVFGEMRWTWKMLFNTFVVVCMGVAQLMIGLAIQLFTMGAMTFAGDGFVNEGMNDLTFAISALWSGHFSWAAYGKQKLLSLAITVGSFGIAAYLSRGSQVSRFGSKLFEAGKCSAKELVGKELIKEVGAKVIVKEFGKQMAVQCAQGIALASVSAGVDHLVENYLRDYCDSLSAKLLGEMNSSLNRNSSINLLRRAYNAMGPEKATQLVNELTREHFAERNVESKYYTYFYQTVDALSRGVNEAASKSSSGNVTGLQLIRAIKLGLTIASESYNLLEMSNLTDSLMNEMEVKLEREIMINEKDESSNTNKHDMTFDRFQLETTEMWKKHLNETIGRQISQKIVSPVLKSFGNFTVFAVGRAIKKCYKHFKNKGSTDSKKAMYIMKKQEEENTIEEENSTAVSRQLDEDNEMLLKMKQAKTAKEMAAIYREHDAPTEITGVLAAIEVAEEELNEKLNVVIVNVDSGKRFSIPSSSEIKGEGRTVLIWSKDGHFYSAAGNKTDDPTARNNDCFYQALAAECPDLKLASKEFRQKVADRIESSQDLVKFVESGQHVAFLEERFYGGRDPGKTDTPDDFSLPNQDNKQQTFDENKSNAEPKGSSQACGKNCRTCVYMVQVTNVTLPSGKVIEIKGNNTCETARVIYKLECVHENADGTKCEKVYIGKTKNSFEIRFGKHVWGALRKKTEIENNDGKKRTTLGLHVDKHNANEPNFSYKAVVLERVDVGVSLAEREQFFINEFKGETWPSSDDQLLNKRNAMRMQPKNKFDNDNASKGRKRNDSHKKEE